MTDRELLELVAAQVGKLTNSVQSIEGRMDSIDSRIGNIDGRMDSIDGRMDSIDGRIDNIDGRINKLEGEVDNIKRIVLHIENDHGAKLKTLFDGYKQNYEKLLNIEEVVKRHDEFILRRVK